MKEDRGLVRGSYDDLRRDPLRSHWTHYPPEEVAAHIRERREKAAEEERRKTEEKVTSWQASLSR